MVFVQVSQAGLDLPGAVAWLQLEGTNGVHRKIGGHHVEIDLPEAGCQVVVNADHVVQGVVYLHDLWRTQMF